MDVRTFEAHNMREALKAVKNTFGPDAVILKTENVNEGSSGLRIIKITATSASQETKLGVGASRASRFEENTQIQDERLTSLDENLKRIQASVATRTQLEQLEGSLDELKLILLESQRHVAQSISADAPLPVQDIERQLRLTAVEDAYIVELVKYLRNLPGPGHAEDDRKRVETQTEYYQSAAIKWALKRIRIAPKWSIIPGSVNIHAFFGSTGVGKTSIIAKLASHYRSHDKHRVLVISHDNLRIAASEQLRVMCKVMNVHFETMNDISEMASLIDKHDEPELVLVDTAGRSTKSTKKNEDLRLFNEVPLPIEKHLVLSMAEKQIQMDRAIRYFSQMGINSLIFNKLDQSWSYGEMFNVINKWNLPASFFGVGQEIPGDFERATRERVIERIFGL